MATSGSEEEDEEEQLSSDDESSNDGSDGSASSGDQSDDASDDASDEDDKGHELKQAQVRGDIQEMRLMVGEMEKIKQRLLFRLESEKQAKLREADWQRRQQQLADEEQQRRQQQLADEEQQRQQQQLADEEQQRQQQQRQQQQLVDEKQRHELQQLAQEEQERQQLRQQREEAEQAARAKDRIAQEAATEQQRQQTLPGRSFVEMSVQTELSSAHAKREDHMHSSVMEQDPRSMEDFSQRQTANTSQQASVRDENQLARLSLYDLGKSYGLKESTASPSSPDSNHHEHPYRSAAQAPPASASRRVPASPSEASDADTFFIRRDSNRTGWQPDVPDHSNDSFRRSQGSVLDSEYGNNEPLGSPTSRAGARTTNSAFDTLRNSILFSIHEGGHSDNVASVASSKLFEPRRSRMSSALSSAADGDDEGVVKTDEQREQEAIQSLLFGR